MSTSTRYGHTTTDDPATPAEVRGPSDLAALDFNSLTETLIGFASRARRHAEEGDVLPLHGLLDQVRGAADRAQGPAGALLEVAEAFLRALARSDLGKSEVALRRFVIEEPQRASQVLSGLAFGDSMTLAALGDRSDRHIGELFSLGVLRVLDDDRVDLRPSLRSLVRRLTC